MLAWAAYLLVVSAAVSLAALGLERAIRPYGFASRWIWMCALFGSFVLPIVLAATARETVGSAPAVHSSLPEVSRGSRSPIRAEWTAQVPVGLGDIGSERFDALVAAAWGVSSAIAAAVLVSGWWYGRRRRRRWRRASVAGIHLLVAADAGPATVGLLHPQIVLPEWLLAAAPETVHLVIAHERSHVEARDPGLLGLGLWLAALMPWNALLWWQVRRLRLAIEVDCDRRVLSGGHDARLYARILVDVSTRRPAYLGGLAASPRSSSAIERRIMLMNAPRIRSWRASTATSALLPIGLAMAVILISPPVIPPAFAGAPDPADAASLDRYVGDYEFATTSVVRIRLRDGQLTSDSVPLTSLSGHLFRVGKVGCCSPDSDSYVRFATDAAGHVIGAVFQQNGVATEAPRIDAQRIRDIEKSISEHVREHAPAPGSEAALRRLILGISSGNPNYAELSPQVAGGTKALLAELQATMKPWGALRSIEFRGVDSRGWDRYLARFERGAASWEVELDPYGLIVGVGTHPESN
jgi:hypothetical protein